MKKTRLAWVGTTEDPEIVRHFIPSGTYKRVSTGYSTRIESEDYCLVWSKSYVGPRLMSLVTETRRHVRDRMERSMVVPVHHRPKFFDLSRFPERPAQFSEVDLASAYLSACERLGAIGPDLSPRLRAVSKRSRLMAVGALATMRTIADIESFQVVRRSKEIEPTKPVWDAAIAEVDREMQELRDKIGKGFLFYWTDAIFVDPFSARFLTDIVVPSTGYTAKIKTNGLARRHKEYILTKDGRRFSL